jgi:hypothetical protein
MDLQTIYILAGLAAAILGIIGKVTGFFKWVMNLYRRIHQPSSTNIKIPKKTVILIPVPNGLWWHMGGRGDKPVMQIVGDLNVTNISNYGVYLKGIRLRKPRTDGHVVVRSQKSDIYGDYMIPRGAISDLRFDLWVEPPVSEKGTPFKGDVTIIDQFGNEHWLKRLIFPYS